MKKRIKITLVVAILVALGAGGYFLAQHFGVFSGRQAVYSQQQNSVAELANDNMQQETDNATEQAMDNVQQEESVDMKKADEQPSAANNQSSATSDKVIEKNTDEAKKDDTKTDETKTVSGKIVSKLVSWGFQKSSGRSIKAVIVHTSYNAIGGDVFDFDKVIQEWKDAGVAPHYAIDRDGTIYQLVSDQNIAWHAGSSKLPDGTTDVNGVSIGIEVINSQDAKFTNDQYGALNSLIATLKKKYSIKYVLGHDDIAPGRKSDPWNIDWGKVKR